jgi:hypothetical protein
MVKAEGRAKRVILYVEGGGETNKLQEPLRSALRKFLAMLPRQPRVLCCGSRGQTLRDFRDGVRDNMNDIHVLLVDSEKSVASLPKAHLGTEFSANEIPNVPDDHYHLMAQVMESWIVADPSCIQKAFPQDAKLDKIPLWQDVESVPKSDVINALRSATSGQYSDDNKRLSTAKILQYADAGIVRQKAKHCDRLLNTLTNLLA